MSRFLRCLFLCLLLNQQLTLQAGTGNPSKPAVSYILPVVFHIISTDPTLVKDAQILAAVQDLNEAFAHTGHYASGPGADTHISFCLATKDPSGGNTTGITRTVSYLADLSSDMEDDRLKSLVDWAPTRYINIWYVSSIEAEVLPTFRCGLWSRSNEGGYATLPPAAGTNVDGIVAVGFGYVLAHEMGHYLGLLHTFQGLNCTNNDCSMDGDMVCDTPPQKDPTGSPDCNTPTNSCSTDILSGFTTDVPDLNSNFMGYANSACINEFTAGQAARMQATIATIRNSLLQPECSPPCPENSIASFTRDNPYPQPGNTVNFTNASTGATQFEWYVNNTVMSTAANFGYVFPSNGKYTVYLKAYNANAACYAAYTDVVIVSCGVTARYYTNKQTIASKAPFYLDDVLFTNRSVNASSYKWLLSDTTGMTDSLVSTAYNLDYFFSKPGVYTMLLVATDGSCTDTTESYPITVLDPTPDGTMMVTKSRCYHRDSIQLSIVLCNNGYAPLQQGTPISFYDADPHTGQAHKLGRSFLLPNPVSGMCCGDTITALIPGGKKVPSLLYAVLNDNGNTIPLALPNTAFPETDYSNNESSFADTPFQVSIAPVDTTVLRMAPFTLIATVSGGTPTRITWDPAADLSCSDCLIPTLTPPYTRQYSVVVQDQHSCISSAYALVTTYTPGDVHIPNAFTPNGDGSNDIFYVMAGADVIAVHHLAIYTRNGSKIFEISNVPPNDPSFGWNGNFKGKPAAIGTYVYTMQISLANGKEESFKGTLELIR